MNLKCCGLLIKLIYFIGYQKLNYFSSECMLIKQKPTCSKSGCCARYPFEPESRLVLSTRINLSVNSRKVISFCDQSESVYLDPISIGTVRFPAISSKYSMLYDITILVLNLKKKELKIKLTFLFDTSIFQWQASASFDHL